MIETHDGTPLRPRPNGVERTDIQGLFLRFESKRERIALPYALLLKLELSLDQRTLELAFATHTVTVGGWDLNEIYEMIADGHARCIRLSDQESPGIPVRRDDRAIVGEFRITRVDPDGRKGR
ncbi:MAG: hypothetical protein HZC55_27120 [Verrucomicrobia bacterium]|nr:hypothetical protein [Verrucomicrobiota bacterium]